MVLLRPVYNCYYNFTKDKVTEKTQTEQETVLKSGSRYHCFCNSWLYTLFYTIFLRQNSYLQPHSPLLNIPFSGFQYIQRYAILTTNHTLSGGLLPSPSPYLPCCRPARSWVRYSNVLPGLSTFWSSVIKPPSLPIQGSLFFFHSSEQFRSHYLNFSLSDQALDHLHK